MLNEYNMDAVTLGPTYIVTNSLQFDDYWPLFVASMRHVPIVAVNCQIMLVSNVADVVHAPLDDERKVRVRVRTHGDSCCSVTILETFLQRRFGVCAR
jgi:hypothetical protein